MWICHTLPYLPMGRGCSALRAIVIGAGCICMFSLFQLVLRVVGWSRGVVLCWSLWGASVLFSKDCTVTPSHKQQESVHLPRLPSVCFLLATPWGYVDAESSPETEPACGLSTESRHWMPGFSDHSHSNGVRTPCGFDLHFWLMINIFSYAYDHFYNACRNACWSPRPFKKIKKFWVVLRWSSSFALNVGPYSRCLRLIHTFARAFPTLSSFAFAFVACAWCLIPETTRPVQCPVLSPVFFLRAYRFRSFSPFLAAPCHLACRISLSRSIVEQGPQRCKP